MNLGLTRDPCFPGWMMPDHPHVILGMRSQTPDCTVHNDLCALPESLDSIVSLAHVRTQVMLADVVDGQDAGELCVSLLGAPLRYPLTPLCLPASRGSPASADRLWQSQPPKGSHPAPPAVALEA